MATPNCLPFAESLTVALAAQRDVSTDELGALLTYCERDPLLARQLERGDTLTLARAMAAAIPALLSRGERLMALRAFELLDHFLKEV